MNKTLIAALASVALFAFTSPVLAQYKPTGDDGITASPKAREFLDSHARNHSTSAAADVAQMSCPKCKDKITNRVDYSARGATKPTILVSTHLCDGCDTTIVTTGVGKNAKTSAVHKCTAPAGETLVCCDMAKVAPLN